MDPSFFWEYYVRDDHRRRFVSSRFKTLDGAIEAAYSKLCNASVEYKGKAYFKFYMVEGDKTTEVR